ncbi:MAG: leucine-rich repeat domain-containing protein [Alloprevotella sp.]|nr:leucine-rich repeat domain-containing protein [Alloprevotella sp.]
MKLFHSFLTLGVVMALLTAMPQTSSATTVTATYNTSSGIASNTNYTVTLDDGTILGFYYNYSDVRFTGAISLQKELTIPDSVICNSYCRPVKIIGYDLCDFSQAQSVTSLTLPATIERIYALPTTVIELHTKGYCDLSSSNLNSLNLVKIYVPEETLLAYYNKKNWLYSALIIAEGEKPLSLTINVAKAGEFAQLLLKKIGYDQYSWYTVNELTVTGELNTNDLNVFKRMRQLVKLDLSKASITDIPDNFCGANSETNGTDGWGILEKLALPEINKIGKYAFAQCPRLKTITIPKVNTIHYGAFAQCGAKQITLPESITSIDKYAFYCSHLNSITIPSSISEISDYCFYGCNIMRSVDIPTSVTKIGNYSFAGCALSSVNLPSIKQIDSHAFYNCTLLKKVILGDELTSLGESVFYNDTTLTSIDLPSSLCTVGGSSFGYCKNIKKVICRAVIPPTCSNNIFPGCDMTDVKMYVPAMSIDKYRAKTGWGSFYTILPLGDKVSYACIYDDATINDAEQFSSDCTVEITLGDRSDNYYSGTSYSSCGTLEYDDNTTFSLQNYKQLHALGNSSSGNPYSYNGYFTSLIANGPIRSDNVQTTLRTSSSSIWYFISFPFDIKVSDITYPDDTQFVIRKYSGKNRAEQYGSTWLNLTTDSVMHAYEGYILKCNKEDAEFTFYALNNTNKNKVFESEEAVIPLGEYISEFEHNRSWNLIGNPYPSYYDIRYMDFSAPITVWNRYNYRYDAYSPVDDNYILHPSQAFFVQRPVEQASITFNKDGRQITADASSLQTRAKSHANLSEANRTIYNIILSDGRDEDRTRFVINEDAFLAYELDKDASKFIDDNNTAMLVYTVENGVKYAINERPLADGEITLGFYAPNSGTYTLRQNTQQQEDIILIDTEDNIETSLIGVYSFSTDAGFHDARFKLKLGQTTGISTPANVYTAFRIENGRVSATAPFTIYSTDGRLIASYPANATANLDKGVYVISSKDTIRKIIVK